MIGSLDSRHRGTAENFYGNSLFISRQYTYHHKLTLSWH